MTSIPAFAAEAAVVIRGERRGRHSRRNASRPSFATPCVAAVIAALAAASAGAADAGYTLGVPGAPVLLKTSDTNENAWLSANAVYPAMAIGAITDVRLSAQSVAGEERVRLVASEGGFPLERTKPEYYLGDQIEAPEGTDWTKTYEEYVAHGSDPAFLFDPAGERVFAAQGGTQVFTWYLAGGSSVEMTYVLAPSCQGRPRRIYWTDYPYNGPAIDLSGKFTKFFGSASLVEPVYGVYTNNAAGMAQVISNRVVSGLFVDSSTKLLYAYGQLQGQVLMAYYETGTFEKILHVQPVEICRPAVNRLSGAIGRALKPDGRGYDTTGLRARPTVIQATDDRGDYLYQHKGQYSSSPKNGQVFPLRPTADCPWNAEIYWMEADEMEVQWPFELDQYACDWPSDTTVFVRGEPGGDIGRKIFVPSAYDAKLMNYQEPDGHAKPVASDGSFSTTGEGYSMLKLTTDDNIWFLPLHSILRANTNYFTLKPETIRVGLELRLREGADDGTTDKFSPFCDPDSPGYVYEAASDPVWNPDLYKAPAADVGSTNSSATASSDGTNTYASVVYAVTANVPENSPLSARHSTLPELEVWWNTTILEDGMPKAVEVPTLPQVYSVRWPREFETPQIAIASQKGSAADSFCLQDMGLRLASTDSTATLATRTYFDRENGGTLMFWARLDGETENVESSFLAIRTGSATDDAYDYVTMDLANPYGGYGNGFRGLRIHRQSAAGLGGTAITGGPEDGTWHNVAVSFHPDGSATVYLDGDEVGSMPADAEFNMLAYLGGPVSCSVGKTSIGGNRPARPGVTLGELLFWNKAMTAEEIGAEIFKAHTGRENHLTGCYTFVDGVDLADTGTDRRTFVDKVVGTRCVATGCLADENGPPSLATGVLSPDPDTKPFVYVQNDPARTGYNPNEEHALVLPGSGGYVAWALRCDLNDEDTSEPGVLVTYVKDGRKAMQWFDVVATNLFYPELAADCVAGKALPGPHPIDLLSNPWCAEDYWDEPATNAPAYRDRKGQLWARSAGDLHVRMYYPMQQGFAFPDVDEENWPAVGEAVPWLALLPENNGGDPIRGEPAPWLWRVSWPDVVPEIEIGRTLTTASSGLPEVWNAKSEAVVWPASDEEVAATALLFDPTVKQTAGFSTNDFENVSALVSALGIKTGAGGNATLRKGKYYFDGLPPSLSSRFYLDTTADLDACLVLVGERENNPGGVSLLHVNVLSESERKTVSDLAEAFAEDGRDAWRDAIAELATEPVLPSPLVRVSDDGDERRAAYVPRDHYALFTMGATNYVTLIENDSTNELMGVSDGDPIQMHVLKVVPKYYVGRVVTREDPLNLLSQQLSVLYAEAFAGKPDEFVFEWRKCRPSADGTVPEDFENAYSQAFAPTTGVTRFVIGAQGDTLDNMVNTYYAMRYRAATADSPAYAAMGDAWSEWTKPPALAEGWVQRVLNNVTPFAQRMRDLVENPAETSVSMLRQAGGPFEGDVALNQDNLAEVGLIQLYETLLDKAESMSLQLGIDDPDANKQLQLAVARLADLYNLLGDEAYDDAMNPTIGIGANFNNTQMTGFEMDYGALSSALFAFDNQVPTLLDEELALLRGRTGENAPALTLSPYYNRLVWNFTRGITAGEVAYAVNYDISGNNTGLIDYQQAAEMYPQGHGDAYGHYLSALSGYYRLLRNPKFTWGDPAMGEMVVADAVLNVDYYDEAAFAKAARNVAKTALAVVDRTARKSFRDSGGSVASGYLDAEERRNFGYGEWASRGGYGALCNWVVGNSLLPEAPHAGRYYRYLFTDADSVLRPADGLDPAVRIGTNAGPWTLEFQLVPSEAQAGAASGPLPILQLEGDDSALRVLRDPATGELTLVNCDRTPRTVTYNAVYWLYTNAVDSADTLDKSDFREIAYTNGTAVVVCAFLGGSGVAAPTFFAAGFGDSGFNSALSAPPAFTGWHCANVDETGAWEPYEFTDEAIVHDIVPAETAAIGTAPAGENTLVAIVCTGAKEDPVCRIFDESGALASSTPVPFRPAVDAADAALGGGYAGEIGEIRAWSGVVRSDAELLAKREYVSPLSEGLALYLRPLEDQPSFTFADPATKTVWYVSGGDWIEAKESGMSVSFEDEGLRRIDRATVPELDSLAALVPEIQTAVDRVDAGLNPLGLASGAIPFDLTPIGLDDGSSSHYEQIRDRAKTALLNAKKTLDRAQTAANRLRLLQESQVSRVDQLETMELEFKNRLIEYFGYPYSGDIGAGGTYPEGYDGPDLYHYQWMDLAQFGISEVDSQIAIVITNFDAVANWGDFLPNLTHLTSVDEEMARTFNLSARGLVVKPANITGSRLAQGKIQDALGEFLLAYSSFTRGIKDYEYQTDQFYYEINAVRSKSVRDALMKIWEEGYNIFEYTKTVADESLQATINTLEFASKQSKAIQEQVVGATPKIIGAGMTVNTDPQAIVQAAVGTPAISAQLATDASIVVAKNARLGLDGSEKFMAITGAALETANEFFDNLDDYYQRVRDAAEDQYDASVELNGKWKALQAAQAAVESVVAEAERVIDERTLARKQAADNLTKARYNEMFFRLARNNALTRYDAAFALAQKYVWLAAQAYDYETGLLSSDPQSGEKFLAQVVGARTLGEFDDDEPAVTSGDGDGGLADILARMDQNWLVLKPRLGANNPQRYATWFSLRRELFRVYPDARGDAAWRTALEKCWVDDLRSLPEFGRFCQPLAGSSAEAEPALVIPFPTEIVFGKNFFGEALAGGDASLDATWFSTRIAAAGVHFEGYNERTNDWGGALPLSRTPTVYLVPVGEDRMRAPGSADKVISWKVVDQTVPAPHAIGSTELDDPDWTPLYTGYTGGADLGANVRRHPSFRAYPGETGKDPSDDELDATRLIGRSAWNTRWLLVIPAGSLGADRDAALSAFIRGADLDRDGRLDVLPVRDILLGLRTYSRSGN
ncbi:MAG: hypothetical protein II839_10200 [Kiritimatiellae bacterium]|nr:hypothetical protein [Kiritimatiellia bacterium]